MAHTSGSAVIIIEYPTHPMHSPIVYTLRLPGTIACGLGAASGGGGGGESDMALCVWLSKQVA